MNKISILTVLVLMIVLLFSFSTPVRADVVWEDINLRLVYGIDFTNSVNETSHFVQDVSSTISPLREGRTFVEAWPGWLASYVDANAYNYFFAPAGTMSSYGYGYNYFSGSFIADGNTVSVNYTADVTLGLYMQNAPGYVKVGNYTNLKVTNQTTGSMLFDGKLFGDEYEGYGVSTTINTSDTYNLDFYVSPGDRVLFNVMSVAEAEVNGGEMDGQSARSMLMGVTVTNTAVAPEPISSALFIAGAATLGAARFKKKRT